MEKGNKSINTKTKSNIENIIIKTTKSVELLGITIDKKKKCKKASLLFNTICHLQKYMGKIQKKQ